MRDIFAEMLGKYARKQWAEERVLCIVDDLAQIFENNDIDAVLGMMEARFRMCKDESQRAALALIVPFLREVNTLRGAAEILSAGVKVQKEQAERG